MGVLGKFGQKVETPRRILAVFKRRPDVLDVKNGWAVGVLESVDFEGPSGLHNRGPRNAVDVTRI